MTSNSILVPLDGSPESNAALPLARTLAKAMKTPITLLRVLSGEDAETAAYTSSHLRRLAGELAESGLSVDSIVRHGRVADEILAEIRTQPAALVVMRTHGRAGVERVILGSVADKVLARSAAPLVLMRPGERRIAGIHSLLVPVDGSPGGAAALGTAVVLARASGACINLVQVTEPVSTHAMVADAYGGMAYYDPDWDDASLASAQVYVEGLVERLRKAGVRADGEAFIAPQAARGIVDSAEKRAADLVVMSTRALTGPARTLLGSVANTVVRTAHCPVLLVHRTEETEAAIRQEDTAAIGV